MALIRRHQWTLPIKGSLCLGGQIRNYAILPNRPTSAEVVNGFNGAVGNTPLVRINSLSNKLGRDIFAKAEWMNPGGSVKDRAALWIVEDAERKGVLKPGGTVVEGTAGNTGIGLAHVCKAKGYGCIIFMPNNQSIEKINLLKALGAKVFAVPPAPFTDPENYNHQAHRYAESLKNAVWTNQFDNVANRQAHIDATGPEIWDQTVRLCRDHQKHGQPSSSDNATVEKPFSAFTCATGTGGTFAGVTSYLKSKNPDIQCILADPPGSVLYEYVQSGQKNLSRTGNGSITEGIGQGRVTDNMKEVLEKGWVDSAVHIPDEESIRMVYDLLLHDGLYVGASSALNIVAAAKVATSTPPHSKIVTILCDSAHRYQSRLFSVSWLKSKQLWESIGEEGQKLAVLD